MATLLWVPSGDREAAAARTWAGERRVGEVGGIRDGVPQARVVWVHAGDRVPDLEPAVLATLTEWVTDGGTLVLTLMATPLAQRVGAPGPNPLQAGPRAWSHAEDPRWPVAFREWPGYPHVRGCQGYGTHPLFAGLPGGAFTWMAREGDIVSGTWYERPTWPPGGVIGVDRSYVHLDAGIAVAWEYALGRGSIRCVGSHVTFTSGDPRLVPFRDRLLENLLVEDWGDIGQRTWWPGAEPRHARVAPVPRARALPPGGPLGDVEPVQRIEAPGDAPVTLGAPHGLMSGTERGGVGELWLHPVCLLDRGIELSVDGEDVVVARCEVSAAHHAREVVQGESAWRETLVGGVDEPAWWYEVAPLHATDATVGMAFAMPVRLAWPMPEDVLHPLRTEVRRHGHAATVLVSGADGWHRVVVHLDGIGELRVTPDDRAPRLQVVGQPGQGIRVGWRTTGSRGASRQADDGMPAALAGQRQRLMEARARSSVVATARPSLDRALAWARARLTNFMTASPHVGTGMAAGHAATRAGWNRSRPGYAWFFGRDTCWCVDALLALGLFEEARTALDLLARTAAPTGKVAHEVSLSGVVHYDAADATPLWVRAVARYAEWTGDEATVRAWWPTIIRALAHVRGCDHDGDGLPENTDEGHGWIEMGPLGGGAVTSYVAACWIDALRALGPVARRVGDRALAADIATWERDAIRGLGGLRLPDGRLALHRAVDGTLEPERTALDAVPIALGVDDSSSARDVMAHLGDASFMAPWGLRMLARGRPLYTPRAYHAGAVWPLFTGWAALADVRVGRGDRGLERLMAISALCASRNRGAFDEVLDGDTGDGAGVCSDQAWSAAALVTPFMTGILGVDAADGGAACRVAAHLPSSLGDVRAERLRVGRTRWSAAWSAGRVTLTHDEGPDLRVRVGSMEAVIIGDGARARRVVHVQPVEDS